MTATEVRDKLVSALRLDLVGPEPGSEHEDEVLPQAPSRWYLTGFLVPYEAPAPQRADETATEQLELGSVREGSDDDTAPEPASARRAYFPSSMGVSVLVPAGAKQLEATVTWGDYEPVSKVKREAAAEEAAPADAPPEAWQRKPQTRVVPIPVDRTRKKPKPIEVPDSGGLRLVVSVRDVARDSAKGSMTLPSGTRAVAVFVVNHREPNEDERKDQAMVFQVALRLRSAESLVARPDPRGGATEDWDDRLADLQYRDVFEFAVGHGVSTHAVAPGGECHEVVTTWMPSAEVEKVEPAGVPDVELGMEALASLETATASQQALEALPRAYEAWIGKQTGRAAVQGRRRAMADALADSARVVCGRIAQGIAALSDDKVHRAFRLANASMAMAARQREAQKLGCDPATVKPPQWRPFQLAFVLMNLRAIAEPQGAERDIVDLLFFPTGGGKTEAYLGLAAFTLVHRRLANPGIASAGVAVLMRYTLRLLTLDQLSRAAALVCALELLRKTNSDLGDWPFEIGLWVGKAATPNRMGNIGDPDRSTARAKTIAFKNNDANKPSPIPLENCPWCGEKFGRDSFQLRPTPDHPTDLRLICMNRRCPFRGDNPLPVLAVGRVQRERRHRRRVRPLRMRRRALDGGRDTARPGEPRLLSREAAMARQVRG